MDATDEAIEEALRRQGLDGCITVPQVRTGDTTADRLTLAHACTIMEFQVFRQEVSDAMTILRNHIDRHGGVITTEVLGHPKGKVVFADFIIARPDPDEELAREVARTGCEQWPNESIEFSVAIATIKRLREQGRLKDA